MRSSRGPLRGGRTHGSRARNHGAGRSASDLTDRRRLMYRWIVFIHIASVLGLLLVHPVTVAFHLKEERNDVRIRELLEVTEAASTLRWVFFGLTIASGVVLGFLGSWWGTAWIWVALAVFVAIGVVMHFYGGRTIDRIAETEDDMEMERLLTRFRPGILAVTGTGGLLLILYLMLFKPTL